MPRPRIYKKRKTRVQPMRNSEDYQEPERRVFSSPTGPVLYHKASITEGKNNLGLRDSEDEPFIQASPSPGARVQGVA